MAVSADAGAVKVPSTPSVQGFKVILVAFERILFFTSAIILYNYKIQLDYIEEHVVYRIITGVRTFARQNIVLVGGF